MSESTHPPSDSQARAGWFRASRSDDAAQVAKSNPFALILAWVIAKRSNYSPGFNAHNLALGEAMLGDFAEYGMSKQNYRTAKKFLATHNFATFRLTPDGTIGRLLDSRLFEVIAPQPNTRPNTQPTPSQHPPNTQPTPNREQREQRELGDQEKKESAAATPPLPLGDSKFIVEGIQIPEGLQSDDFLTAWQTWLQHRRETRHKVTPTQAGAQLKELAAWGQARAIAAINFTITKGWQGIRQPEANLGPKGKPQVIPNREGAWTNANNG